MKFIIILLLCFTSVAWGEEESFFSDNNEELVFDIGPSWIISNELIERLNLKPYNWGEQPYALVIEGEDGEQYDWCSVLKAHMDWVEEKLESELEEETKKPKYIHKTGRAQDYSTSENPWPIATLEDIEERGYYPGSKPGIPYEVLIKQKESEVEDEEDKGFLAYDCPDYDSHIHCPRK